MSKEVRVDAVAGEEDIDPVPGLDAVGVLDVVVVREELLVGEAEEGGDVAEVEVRGDIVGCQRKRAPRPASGFGSDWVQTQ